MLCWSIPQGLSDSCLPAKLRTRLCEHRESDVLHGPTLLDDLMPPAVSLLEV